MSANPILVEPPSTAGGGGRPSRRGGRGRLILWRLLGLSGCVCVGVLIGLAITAGSLDPDHRGTTLGPWRVSPRDGGLAVDPYALASNARFGLLPLGSAEGLTFAAREDDGGRALDPACDYLVRGPMPPTRYWTLSLLDVAGFPLANPANRYDFTSAEILRFGEDAAGSIVVSARARPGNWLPIAAGRRFQLMLRLYDTSLSTGKGTLDKVPMPSITRSGCP